VFASHMSYALPFCPFSRASDVCVANTSRLTLLFIFLGEVRLGLSSPLIPNLDYFFIFSYLFLL